MSRTIKQIYEQIVEERNKRLELSEFSSNSKLSIMNGITWTVAAAIHSFETLLDVFAIDISEVINNRVNGTPTFYVNAVLQFQKGDELSVREDGLAFGYANIDTTKCIVTQASYAESSSDINLDNKLILKVATGESGNLHAIVREDLILLTSYINKIKFMGTRVEVTSSEGDILVPRVSVYYDGSVLESEIYDNLEEKLNDLMAEIKFDSTIYVSNIIEALRSAEHITDVYIDINAVPQQGVFLVSYNSDGAITPMKKIERMTFTNSGYLKQSSGKGTEIDIPNFRESIKLIVETRDEI